MFHRLEFRVHRHATEEEARVLAAFRFLTGVDEPDREEMEGLHGNPIVVLRATLERSKDVQTFWGRVKAGGALTPILRTLDRRVDDDGLLHVRFDKQEAYQERVAVASHDDVITLRGKVAAYPAKRERALKVARAYLEAV